MKSKIQGIVLTILPFVVAVFSFYGYKVNHDVYKIEKALSRHVDGEISNVGVVGETGRADRIKGDITYVVTDVEYTNSFTANGDYKNGDKLTVYYNPANPDMFSVVKPKPRVGKWLLYLAVGIVSLAWGVLFASAVYGAAKRRKMEEEDLEMEDKGKVGKKGKK